MISEFDDLPLPPMQPFHGDMYANRVREALFARIEREKAAFQRAMNDLQNAQNGPDSEGDDAQKQMVDIEMVEDESGEGGVDLQVSLDGEVMNLTDELKDLMGSIMQDFGEIPDEHLDPTELGRYNDELLPQTGEADGDLEGDTDGAGTFTYREWD